MRIASLATLITATIASPVLADGHEEPAQDERVSIFAELQYWPGYWVSEMQSGTMIGGQSPAIMAARARGEPLEGYMSLNARGAAWNDHGRELLAEVRRISRGRKADGWGYPMMMDAATPIQFLITPEQVLITNAYNETRHIYTDGRPMPDEYDMWPTTYGTSIGRWEGETLVIETVMVSTPSDYFHGAPPFSEDARYIEHISMEGDRLVATMRVEDPATLEEPYETTVSWLRDEAYDRMIQINWDNDRTSFDGEYNTIESTPQD